MNPILATILQAVFVLGIAPFAAGLVKFCKARLQGRKGASPLLPYYTFATLFKKEMVIPEAASWVFRAAPFVVFASSAALVFILPLAFTGSKLASLSDFLVVGGILIVSSVFLVLGGLDPGSAFGGMGSSREMTIASLLEPTIIMVFAAMGFAAKTFAIDGMVGQNLIFSHPYLLLSLIALVLVALGENARYPVDNPATHLELTMVHEAMILEYSGPYLAMMEAASAIKLTVFSLLIANFLLPSTVVAAASLGLSSVALAIIWTIVKVVVAMALLALLETTIVKMRFYRMSEYMSIAFFVALFGMIGSIAASFSSAPIPYYAMFAMLTVILTVMLFARVRFKAILRYYALASLAIAGIAYGLSLVLPEEERSHLWIFAAVTIIVKSVGVPFVINRWSRIKKSTTGLPSFLKPGTSYFFAVMLLAITFFILQMSPVSSMVKWGSLLYAAVSLVVLGLAMMIVQRNIFSQIIGLLVAENGIAVFVLATVGSLPLSIEMGVFSVTIISAFILSVLSARIRELHGSTDTEQLRTLTEE